MLRNVFTVFRQHTRRQRSIQVLTLLGFATAATAITVPMVGIPRSNCDFETQKESAPPRVLTSNFVADAAEVISPAVVNIEAPSGHPLGGVSTGSGFVISKDGFVVTNAHVVSSSSYGNGGLVVTFWDGRKRKGRVWAADQQSDIALVKVTTDDTGEELPVAEFGSSSALRVGEFVVAVGSPFRLQNTVTHGIVSATARHASELGLAKNRSEYIQTDASINVGNSGGPLVNLDGEVVGINTMKVNGSSGVSFAIPIDTAAHIIQQLMTNRRVVRPYIGMRMASVVSGESGGRRRPKQPLSTEETSVMILDVDNDSPASKAGLQSGDIIIGVNGKHVRNVRDILDAIGLDVGRTVEFKVRRGSNEFMTPVVSGISRE